MVLNCLYYYKVIFCKKKISNMFETQKHHNLSVRASKMYKLKKIYFKLSLIEKNILFILNVGISYLL